MAAKMSREFFQGDVGLIIFSVQFLCMGMENRIHAFFPGKVKIPLKVSRIGFKIFIGAELGRIYKDAQHQLMASLFTFPQQRQVPFVKKPHGGDKPDGHALFPDGVGMTLKCLGSSNDFDGAFLPLKDFCGKIPI